ncbi:MAG: pyridoxamine 5'-phosphate oxidase family protein [Candidatus Omnitrophica bacterium]|nr:pyridoxamine 5'-phosphate oxidase family protein [Candidatus Omnitrophota bacterium]
MIKKRINELLKMRNFISVATCDFKGRPNAAPKFLLRCEDSTIYLVDYTIGRTWENLKMNPRVGLSFMDTESLRGYQINGSVQILEKGAEYDDIVKELEQKEINLSTERIINAITTGKRHESYELAIPKKFVIFKVSIEEAVEIGPSGVKRESV